MGHSGTYSCNNCGNEFSASEGGGRSFIELRCEVCDGIQRYDRREWPLESDLEPQPTWYRVYKLVEPENEAYQKEPDFEPAKYASREELETARERFKCPDCGVVLRDDLRPMCPMCRSRDVREMDIDVHYD